MSSKKLATVILPILPVVVIGVLATLAIGRGMPRAVAPAGNASSQLAAGCLVPDSDDLVRAYLASHAPPGRGQRFPHEDWLANGQAQTESGKLNRLLARAYGNGGRGVRNGYIGRVGDDHEEEVVVVVDENLVDITTLEERIGKTVNPEKLAVKVQASCNSAADLLATRAAMAAGDWIPDDAGQEISYAVSIDPATSAVLVELGSDPGALAAGSALEREFGSLVHVVHGAAPVRRPGRAG